MEYGLYVGLWAAALHLLGWVGCNLEDGQENTTHGLVITPV